jgi:UDP:flavonoid glycosyltransferase YjiC (YdhE family)
MRMLFTVAGGNGHLEPLVPLARFAKARGHKVAFACRPLMVPRVAALGFAAFATGSDVGLTPERRPLITFDLAHELEVVGRSFARRIADERVRDMLPLCRTWQPDLLVCEELDFGAMLVAEQLRLPHATVLVIAAGSFVQPSIVAPPLNELRAAYGLPPDPDVAMPSRYLVLSPFPPTYRDPQSPVPATTHLFRPLTPDASASSTVPAWLAPLPKLPTVYFTLGTVFNVESGDLFQRVLAGVATLPINVLVTVGHGIDPAELGPPAANVSIAQYIPQASVLPHCQLVVSHGGSGSVIGALAHGLPLVILPMGADQPLNAARCQALHVAQILDAVAATPAQIAATVATTLSDARYKQAAQAMQIVIAALPEPASAVALLERLAREKQPIYSENSR